MTPEELEAAIRAGNLDHCIALITETPEPARRAAAPMAQRWLTAAWGRHLDRGSESEIDLPTDPQKVDRIAKAAAAAVAGTCTLSELKAMGWRVWHLEEPAWRLLAARRVDWLQGWAEWVVGENSRSWLYVRTLAREGFIAKPETADYTIAMIGCVWPDSPLGLLRADPGLLDDEVWRLFTVEGAGENSLAARDKYSQDERSWSYALHTLCSEGKLDRDRLLDDSLGALNRDFAQFRAGWFAHFHEALSPTLEERAARIDGYLALLASPIPPTVSFALKALTVLDKADRLPAEAYVGHVAPALGAREKGTVKSTLRLLDRAARHNPAVASAVAALSCEAMLHESPDVQEAGFKLIARYGDRNDPELCDLVRARLEDLAASQRPSVEEWLGVTSEPASSAGPVPASPADLSDLEARVQALPASLAELAGVGPALEAARAGQLAAIPLRLNDLRISKLDAAAEIVPITTFDELLERFAALIESPDSPDEIERVLDGVSRLCDQRPEAFERQTAPLRKRAAKLSERGGNEPWVGWAPQDLPDLALVWLGGPIPDRVRWNAPDLNFFLGERVLELARRVHTRSSAPLLGAPTHFGGWIDPRTLVARLRTWPAEVAVPPHESIQALLRLAPDHRAEALAEAADLPGELGAAVRYALGGDEAVGATAALWVAASRARNPYADDAAVAARHPKQRGPDAACVGQSTLRVSRRVFKDREKEYLSYRLEVDVKPLVPDTAKADTPTVLFHGKAESELHTRRWLATLWPLGREAWFARGCALIGDNLDWWEAQWPNRIHLEALLEPDTDLNGMGGLLLGLGLATKEPGESGLATDALIAAISDGRLTTAVLGDVLAQLAALGTHSTVAPEKPGGLIKGARWSKTLGNAARHAPLHAEVVHGALQLLLSSAPSLRPADLAALLELLNELSISVGAAINDEGARSYLSGIKGGKSGKLAQALLALAAKVPRAHLRRASIQALTGRIERAERWAAAPGHHHA